MSMPDEALREEYERSKRIRTVIQAELDELPAGAIFRKNVQGKMVSYLQKREGDKIISTYISKRDIPGIEKKIVRRNQLQASVHSLDDSIGRLEKALK